MWLFLGKRTKVALLILLVVIIGKLAWSHRQDDWVQQWWYLQAPEKARFEFDNGSVRDTHRASDGLQDKPSSELNEAGKLKKCLTEFKVIYTDKVCPPGAKVAAVTGGSVVVLDSGKPKATDDKVAQGGQARLRDALDISVDENLRAKMQERAMNR